MQLTTGGGAGVKGLLRPRTECAPSSGVTKSARRARGGERMLKASARPMLVGLAAIAIVVSACSSSGSSSAPESAAAPSAAAPSAAAPSAAAPSAAAPSAEASQAAKQYVIG